MTHSIKYEDTKLVEIQQAVKEEMQYFGKTIGKPTLRNFADWLTEDMPQYAQATMSHATIINWRNHGRPFFTKFFYDVLAAYPATDRRHLFAIKMLAAKRPHIWGVEGLVWRLKKNGTFK